MRVLIAAAALLASAAPASAAWHEARTKHFIILSEQRPDELKSYAVKLERFDAAVRQVRGWADPPLSDGARLTVFDLPNVLAIQKLASDENIAGFYVPRASGPVAFVSTRDRSRDRGANDHTLQHEYTHHLMLTHPDSPLAAWLVEGTAEFFGTAQVENNGGVKIGFPPQRRAYGILNDIGFSAGDLLAGARPKNDLERSSVYGKGWLLTHYLAFNQARRGQLSRYVDGLARGEPGAKAAAAAFGDLKQLDKEIDIYATKSFSALRVAPGPVPDVQIRRLSDGEAAIMPVRIRVDRGRIAAELPALTEEARGIAARYPNDAAVQTVLAEVELNARRVPEAIAAADRALAADPKNINAMILKGRALLADARGKGPSADWTQVRRWLVQANRADTENAEPLYLYYQSFPAARQKPTADAIKGLYYAHLLAPHDVGLRYTVVRQHLIDGDLKAAQKSFAPIFSNPHIELEKRPKLVEAMDKMRGGDAQGAIAALNADYRTDRGGGAN